MKISPSLSTIWFKGKEASLKSFFQAAQKAGFTSFELDQSVSLADIANINLPQGCIRSLEIPCPTHPAYAGAHFSSTNRYEREAARQGAENSFNLAADLNAKVLIVHLGQVEISLNLEKTLWQVWQTSGPQSDTFQDLNRELKAIRARNAPRQLEMAFKDVDFLANRALQTGLKIALITPALYTALPLPDELARLLAEFDDLIYYWHDPARAKILDTLTLIPEDTWPAAAAKRLAGINLHDVIDLQSQYPPLSNGSINFESLRPYISNETLLTCRFASSCSSQELAQGLQTLTNRLQHPL